jgi:predicted PurR-regulated permease PerM
MSWTKLAVMGLTIVSLLIIWKTHQIWSAAFLGVLLALSLNGPAEWLHLNLRWPRWLATLLVMFVGLLTLAGLGGAIGSLLAVQFDELFKKLPDAIEKVVGWLDQRSWGQSIIQRVDEWSGMSNSLPPKSDSLQENSLSVNAYGGMIVDVPPRQLRPDVAPDQAKSAMDAIRPEDVGSSVPDFVQILGHIFGALSVTFKTGTLLAVSMLVMLFVAFDPQVYERGVLWMVPKQYEGIARQTMDRLCVAMRWWMAGRLASMTAVGVLTSLGMWMIGMPAPLALGAIAGLLSFVPNIGPMAAALPGLLLALGQSPWMVVWAGGIYVAAQLVESNAITPLVEQYAIAVPPGVLIVTQFVFAALGGVWGMIIATPLLVVAMVLVQQLYVNGSLHKPIEVTGST